MSVEKRKAIALGFEEDALQLIHEFKAAKNLDFATFADIWKKQKFSMIFLGRPNEKEMLEFTREIFRITMDMLFKLSFENKVGALYMLYGLVRYQTIKPAIRARVTPEHWEHIEKIRDTAEAKGQKSVLFVVRYLIRYGFDFVAYPTLLGPCIASVPLENTFSNRSSESAEDVHEKSLELKASITTCLQELQAKKDEYDEKLYICDPHETRFLRNNFRFLDLLNQEDDEDLSTSTRSCLGEETSDDIGHRRSKLKASAFGTAVSKPSTLISAETPAPVKPLKKKPRKEKKKGRPRKVPDEEKEAEDEDVNLLLPVPEPAPKRYGQKREKLFKEKYRFLEDPSSTKEEET